MQVVAESAHGEQQGETLDRGLLLIGIFKVLKSLFFVLVGFGALHLVHRDLGDELQRLLEQHWMQRIAGALRFDTEGRVVSLVMSKVDLITAERLRQIGFGAFAYSALAMTEGVGLLLKKPWAEYLTLGLTVSFLPWELYEIARRPSPLRLSLLVINLAVLWYLVWLLRRKRQMRSKTGQ